MHVKHCEIASIFPTFNRGTRRGLIIESSHLALVHFFSSPYAMSIIFSVYLDRKCLTLNNRTASLITFILQVTIMKTSPYLVILFLKILVSLTAGQELFRSQNSLGSRRTNFHNDLRSQSQREVFFVNLEDGFFGCQVNASVDILQLFEISKLCDGTPNCYLGSDESNPRLKCTSK